MLRSCAAMTTDALALAAQQQPQGTIAASVLSAAAGRAFLRIQRARPSKSCSKSSPARSDLVNALAVAANQQPYGTRAASALAAASGRAFLRISRRLPSKQHRARSASSHILADALAVAARQQPPGTLSASVLAAAAGRSFLRASKGTVVAKHCCPKQRKRSSIPKLCDDASGHIFGQLWPVQRLAHGVHQAHCDNLPAGMIISPRTIETRLRQSKPIFGDLGRVSAVSSSWCQHVDRDGWPSTHAYLFQEPGSKLQLQERYTHSMRRLMAKDWLQLSSTGAPGLELRREEDLVSHIVAFMA